MLILIGRLRVEEIYRVRLTLHRAVTGLTQQLRSDASVPIESAISPSPREALRFLLPLYDQVIAEEWMPDEPQLSTLAADEFIKCDSCSADIFRIFWACTATDSPKCLNSDKISVTLCSHCVVQVRSVCPFSCLLAHRWICSGSRMLLWQAQASRRHRAFPVAELPVQRRGSLFRWSYVELRPRKDAGLYSVNSVPDAVLIH